jgi:hypothetical protein
MLIGDTVRAEFDRGANLRRLEPERPSAANGQAVALDPAASPSCLDRPTPMGMAAYHGLAGEIVAELAPQTEAAPEVLLLSLLAAFGSAVGRGPHRRVGDDHHGPNLFLAVVGKTSRGRKGTSWGRIAKLMAVADPAWSKERVVNGLRSGEALIDAVRDRRVKVKPDGSEELVDEGEDDKRLLVLEEELASVLRMMQREGSTISPVARQAWDRPDLRNLSKGSPARATGALVSIIGHITAEELRRTLDRTELANGFANRFLFVAAYRSKLLPDGGEPSDAERLGGELRRRLVAARAIGAVERDGEARALWHAKYEDLSRERPGLLGQVTSRAEAQVTRLSLVLALLDGTNVVNKRHLEAALEIWRYCRASAAWIFGDSLGDPLADTLLAALRRSPEGMSRSEISAALGRNQPAEAIGRALAVLADAGVAESVRIPTHARGRAAELWKQRGSGA